MTTAVKAIYEDGVFKPKEPVKLQEKTEVEVLIPAEAKDDDDPTGWKTAREFIGMWERRSRRRTYRAGSRQVPLRRMIG